MSDAPQEGYAYPYYFGHRRHYYRNGRAVCGLPKWGHSGPYDQNHAHPDNCGYCVILSGPGHSMESTNAQS